MKMRENIKDRILCLIIIILYLIFGLFIGSYIYQLCRLLYPTNSLFAIFDFLIFVIWTISWLILLIYKCQDYCYDMEYIRNHPFKILNF